MWNFFQREEVSEVETIMGSTLQWETDSEITVKEKWDNKLTVSVSYFVIFLGFILLS